MRAITRWSRSQSEDIGDSAKKHGHDLLKQGFTIDQVVHDYGDVCQSITELAVELGAPISTDDFRTLNRCLDNAIAGAVTEFTLEQGVTRDKQSAELHNLTEAAIFAFRAIRAGVWESAGAPGPCSSAACRDTRRSESAIAEPKPKEISLLTGKNHRASRCDLGASAPRRRDVEMQNGIHASPSSDINAILEVGIA